MSELSAKNSESQLFLSLQNNVEFLTNIIRKSIYEHYVKIRYIMNNTQKTKNLFEKKNKQYDFGLELMQVDMLISMIENFWVK